MTRPKVLLTSSLYAPDGVGGAERVVQTLAESFASTGVDSVVVTLTPDRAPRTDVVNEVTVHRLPIANFYWPFGRDSSGSAQRALWHARDAYNPKAGSLFGDVLATEEPDVVNTHNIAGFSVSVWKQVVDRGIPLVHTLHDQYLLCPRTTMYRDGENCPTPCRSCQVYTWPRRRLAGLPNLVTGPSEFILDRHAEYGWFTDTERRVVHNAIAPDIGTSDRAAVSGDAPFRFGFLGRIAETKGLDVLLRAFSALRAGRAELVIAGTGEPGYERSLRQITGERDDVRWLGFVDASTLLDQIDVLVVPSTWEETSGLVVLEAFAHGRPVLGSDRGGIPELVELGAGWIFDPDDQSGFEEHLAACIGRRGQLAELAETCRRASAAFTVERMVDGYRSAYRAAGTERF